MSLSVETYALSKKYTNDSISGISGTLAGKNCTIQSITDIEGGHRVTFQWTADNGTVRTQTMDVTDGSGAEAIEQIYADNGILGAKNLLLNNATSQTINDVTFTINNADGSVTVNGRATADTVFIIKPNTTEYNDKDLILSGCPSGGSQSTYDLIVRVANSSDQYIANIHDTGSGAQLTPEAGLTGTNLVRVQIYIKSGYNANNLTFYPMIRLASDPDDTYVPYAMTNRELTAEKADNSAIAPVESSTTASQAYAANDFFIMNGTLYKVISEIAQGGTITVNTNCTATTITEILTALLNA